MRISGVRIGPEYARALVQIVDGAGFDGTAARLAQAIEMRVTTEAPLTTDDHEAILASLEGQCPAALYRLRRELENERRLRRGPAGGAG